MMKTENVCASNVKKLIDFDLASGEYFWKKRQRSMFKTERDCNAWNTMHAGKSVFKSPHSEGYRRIAIGGVRLLAHRVIWAYHHGEWPNGMIDHINGNRSDNRLENLRVVSSLDNARNARYSDRTGLGCIGVRWDRANSKWRAAIGIGGRKTKHIGMFVNLDDAINARKLAEVQFGYHPNHGVMAS
jgi:hypothetical protein